MATRAEGDRRAAGFSQRPEDPEQNGDGALYDFGCYGADLVTWLMHGESPVSVAAVTQTDKPQIYPRVADEATIILRYPKAQAVLMPSWNWPFSRKDMEVYGATGYIITVGPDKLRLRFKGQASGERGNRSAAYAAQRWIPALSDGGDQREPEA